MEQPGSLKSEALQPKRVLRVGNEFGIYEEGDTSFILRSIIDNPFHQAEILTLFRNNGYRVVRGGSFDYQNSLELGFDINQHTDQEVAIALGLKTPGRIDIMDTLQTNSSIVAKALFGDRGELKYLLETPEQKARFIAWLIGWGKGIIHSEDIKASQIEIEGLLGKARGKKLSDKDYSKADPNHNWIFEEYIISPSNYNTSYRVLVDGYGNIHYAQLHRSPEVRSHKNTKIITDTHVPIFEGYEWGDDFCTLLTHPRSPLFLDSVDFVSNTSQGGTRISLNGRKVTSTIDRKVLSDHGLDPDNPQAPSYILEKSSQAGILNRDSFPYTGVDFMQDKDGDFYFLEINSGPMLNPVALSLPQDTTQGQLSLEMMRRVVLK